jgi:hypothetical protein
LNRHHFKRLDFLGDFHRPQFRATAEPLRRSQSPQSAPPHIPATAKPSPDSARKFPHRDSARARRLHGPRDAMLSAVSATMGTARTRSTPSAEDRRQLEDCPLNGRQHPVHQTEIELEVVFKNGPPRDGSARLAGPSPMPSRPSVKSKLLLRVLLFRRSSKKGALDSSRPISRAKTPPHGFARHTHPLANPTARCH